jgi:hypothetical protein
LVSRKIGKELLRKYSAARPFFLGEIKRRARRYKNRIKVKAKFAIFPLV